MPNPFAGYAFSAWKKKYGQEPPWATKVYPMLAKAQALLKGDLEAAKLSWDTYLGKSEAFYRGHDPGLFLAQLPRFATYPKTKRLPTDSRNNESSPVEQRAKVMASIYADPQFNNDTQRRDEYIRQVRERWPV